MKTTTKYWILLTALIGATMASALPAQTSLAMSRTSSSSGTTVIKSSHGITRVMTGGGEEPQVKDDLFAGTEQFSKNATDVTEINMGPDSLDSVRGTRYAEARSTVLKVVRSYGYDKPGLYDMAAVEAFRNKLNSGDWHCTVHTRNMKTGESTDVCSKHRTDGFREEAIVTIEPKELTFIHTISKIKEGEAGHSEMFYGPMPGMTGAAMMALMNPENFVDMLLAQHGVILNQMQGMMDLKIDMARAMADSQLAAIRPFTLQQLDGLSRNLSIHVDPQPNMHVHVRPDVHVHVRPDHDAELAAPPAPEAPPAPAAPEAPEAPESK